jgi:hypothetical protein
MSLAVARAAPPCPRYTAPPPRPSPGWWSGSRGRRPVVTPGLRRRDVLARRGDPRDGHHREIPGNSAGHRGGWPAGRGPVRRGGLAGRRQGAGVLVTAMPRSRCRRATAATTPAGDRASTGHVGITIWRRYGCDPFRMFSQPSQPNGICPGNRGWRRQGLPGHVPWHRTAIRRTCTVHRRVLCTAPYTRDLAGAGVIGARSHAGPGYRKGSSCPSAFSYRSGDHLRNRGGSAREDPKN